MMCQNLCGSIGGQTLTNLPLGYVKAELSFT